jgi:hypothetical protein
VVVLKNPKLITLMLVAVSVASFLAKAKMFGFHEGF